MPITGRNALCAMPVFASISRKSNIATPVVSLPVPEVVGMAISGFSGPGTGLPSPIGAFTYARKSAGHVAYKFAAFAVSMLDPPPTATYPSKLPSVANAIASLNDTSVGSTLTLSNSTASMPSFRSDSSVISTASLLAIRGSVTTITRRVPSRCISYPTSRVTPTPNLMLEVSIV